VPQEIPHQESRKYRDEGEPYGGERNPLLREETERADHGVEHHPKGEEDDGESPWPEGEQAIPTRDQEKAGREFRDQESTRIQQLGPQLGNLTQRKQH
jgi:hypothetical protein